MTLDDLNLDDATRVALAALSRRMKRTPEQIAAEAIREVVRDTEALLSAIEASVAQADAGSTMTLDEWRAFKRRPSRRCR
jgi:predicted transcriptional regulator